MSNSTSPQRRALERATQHITGKVLPPVTTAQTGVSNAVTYTENVAAQHGPVTRRNVFLLGVHKLGDSSVRLGP